MRLNQPGSWKTWTIETLQTALPFAAAAAVVLLLPQLAHAAPPGVTNELQVVEDTKNLVSDVAAYAKYILPTVALAYYGWGSIQRTMAGDDDMKKSKADRTLANAKVGLILGFAASPILLWIQKYYEH
jgi:hypothetical protein